MSSCNICIEPFNKTPNRKQAKCPYCDVQACVKCTQTYLMNTHEDPHCMNCRKGWSREVIDSILLTTWRNDDYKKHRQNILLDREKSRLPAAQIILERQKLAEGRIEMINEIKKKSSEYFVLYSQELRRYDHELGINRRLLAGEDVDLRPVDENGRELDLTAKEKEEKEKHRLFVMPCPGNDCRGFLSSAYKCGICDRFTCPDCREVKGLNRDVEHTCNPDSVANVRALKKECRCCPECGASIFRIEGCSQMFCTMCKTGFDWNTGKKVTTGAIHNPHYFEYLRLTNGGVVPRTAGDIPCVAGRMPNPGDIYIVSRAGIIPPATINLIGDVIQVINHIRYTEIPRVTNGAEDSDNTELNIKYLRNEHSEARWKQLLQQREKRRMRRDEIRQQYEALVGAAADIMSRYPSRTTIDRIVICGKDPDENVRKTDIDRLHTILKEIIVMLTSLREMFNTNMLALSKRYNTRVLIINHLFKREYTKAPKKIIKKAKVANTATNTISENSSDTEDDDASV